MSTLAVALVVLDPGGGIALELDGQLPVEHSLEWTDDGRTQRLSVWIAPMTDGDAVVELETARVRDDRLRRRRRDSLEVEPGVGVVLRAGKKRAPWEVRLRVSEQP